MKAFTDALAKTKKKRFKVAKCAAARCSISGSLAPILTIKDIVLGPSITGGVWNSQRKTRYL